MAGSSCIYPRHFLKDREVDKGKWLMQPCWMVQTIRRGVGKGALGFKHFAAYSMSPCLAMERHSPSLNGRRVETFFRPDAWTWPSRTSGCNRDETWLTHINLWDFCQVGKDGHMVASDFILCSGPWLEEPSCHVLWLLLSIIHDFRHVQTS